MAVLGPGAKGDLERPHLSAKDLADEKAKAQSAPQPPVTPVVPAAPAKPAPPKDDA